MAVVGERARMSICGSSGVVVVATVVVVLLLLLVAVVVADVVVVVVVGAAVVDMTSMVSRTTLELSLPSMWWTV